MKAESKAELRDLAFYAVVLMLWMLMLLVGFTTYPERHDAAPPAAVGRQG